MAATRKAVTGVPAQSKARRATDVPVYRDDTAAEPVRRAGRAATKVRKATHAGQVRYECVACDYTNPSKEIVRRHHRNKHESVTATGPTRPDTGDPAGPTPVARPAAMVLDGAAGSLTLVEVLSAANGAVEFGAQLAAAAEETRHWRARAEAAEAALSQVTAVLDRAGLMPA